MTARGKYQRSELGKTRYAITKAEQKVVVTQALITKLKAKEAFYKEHESAEIVGLNGKDLNLVDVRRAIVIDGLVHSYYVFKDGTHSYVVFEEDAA